ncbi:MAG TPA: hypothetical protein VGI24_11935 [Solirubrobacteraceae bacterium]
MFLPVVATVSIVVLPAMAQAPVGPQAGCPPVATPPAPLNPTTSIDIYHPAPEALLACVGPTPVTGMTFAHWFTIAERSASLTERAHSAGLLQEVMGFLISSDWIIGEAQELHIVVTDAKVRRTFDHIRHQQFPRTREFTKFLESSGQTVEDLLLRVRLNLLTSRILAHASKHGGLSPFVRHFRKRWLKRTSCQKAYKVSDCGQVLNLG